MEALAAFSEDVYYCSLEYGPEDVRTSLGYYNMGKVFGAKVGANIPVESLVGEPPTRGLWTPLGIGGVARAGAGTRWMCRNSCRIHRQAACPRSCLLRHDLHRRGPTHRQALTQQVL